MIAAQTSWTILQAVDLPTPNKCPIVLNSQGVAIATRFSNGMGLKQFVMTRVGKAG